MWHLTRINGTVAHSRGTITMEDRELLGRFMNPWYSNQPPEVIQHILNTVAACTDANQPFCVFDRGTLVRAYQSKNTAEAACASASAKLTLMWFK